MRLDVADRIVLMGPDVLPDRGPYADLVVMKAIRDAVRFTPAESARWGVVQDGGTWHWEEDEPDPALPAPAIGDEDTRPRVARDVSADFNIGERGRAIITTALVGLDREGRLAPYMVGLYEKFVRGPEQQQNDAAHDEAAATGPVQPVGEALAPVSEFDGPDAPIAPVGAEEPATMARAS